MPTQGATGIKNGLAHESFPLYRLGAGSGRARRESDLIHFSMASYLSGFAVIFPTKTLHEGHKIPRIHLPHEKLPLQQAWSWSMLGEPVVPEQIPHFQSLTRST